MHAVVFLIPFLIPNAGESSKTSCTFIPPEVTESKPSSSRCKFEPHLRNGQRFTFNRDNRSSISGKDKLLTCEVKDISKGKADCEDNQPEYVFEELRGNEAIFDLPFTRKDQAGTYHCQREPQDPNGIEGCPLKVKDARITTTCNVSHVKGKEAVLKIFSNFNLTALRKQLVLQRRPPDQPLAVPVSVLRCEWDAQQHRKCSPPDPRITVEKGGDANTFLTVKVNDLDGIFTAEVYQSGFVHNTPCVVHYGNSEARSIHPNVFLTYFLIAVAFVKSHIQ